jgi:hypothetical protein
MVSVKVLILGDCLGICEECTTFEVSKNGLSGATVITGSVMIVDYIFLFVKAQILDHKMLMLKPKPIYQSKASWLVLLTNNEANNSCNCSLKIAQGLSVQNYQSMLGNLVKL